MYIPHPFEQILIICGRNTRHDVNPFILSYIENAVKDTLVKIQVCLSELNVSIGRGSKSEVLRLEYPLRNEQIEGFKRSDQCLVCGGPGALDNRFSTITGRSDDETEDVERTSQNTGRIDPL